MDSTKLEQTIKSLSCVSEKIDAEQTRYESERQAILKKFQAQFETLWKQRHDIVTGKHEPTDDELAEPSSLPFSITVGKDAPEKSDEVGIPRFWIQALRSSPLFEPLINMRDEKALEFLVDIVVEKTRPPTFPPETKRTTDTATYITFVFAPNPFFKNRMLSIALNHVTNHEGTSYFLTRPFDEEDGSDDEDSSDSDVPTGKKKKEKPIKTPIEWRKGMEIGKTSKTVMEKRVVRRKVKKPAKPSKSAGKGSKAKKPVEEWEEVIEKVPAKVTLYRPTFFDLFLGHEPQGEKRELLKQGAKKDPQMVESINIERRKTKQKLAQWEEKMKEKEGEEKKEEEEAEEGKKKSKKAKEGKKEKPKTKAKSKGKKKAADSSSDEDEAEEEDDSSDPGSSSDSSEPTDEEERRAREAERHMDLSTCNEQAGKDRKIMDHEDFEERATSCMLFLATRLVPRAVQWYFGEGKVEDDEDEGDDESDDDDDDDYRPPKGRKGKGGRGGGQALQCTIC